MLSELGEKELGGVSMLLAVSEPSSVDLNSSLELSLCLEGHS